MSIFNNLKKGNKMANEFDIFNLSAKDLKADEGTKKTGSDLYAPKADQGKDGVYRALIRFLPNLKNPRKPMVRKYIYWLDDPTTGKGFFVDSPSTVGERCPVQDMFFKLRNSESAVDKKMSEALKRREVHYGLVQIVKDPQNPDLEGQIKIFKFGYKIKTKIDEELNPQFDEPTQIFDPFEGKNFELVISKKGGYPSYDSCKFQGTRSAMTLNGETVTDNDESRKAIVDYLQAGPDLSNFEYQPWDEGLRGRVMNVLGQFSSPGESIGTLTTQTAPTTTSPVAGSSATNSALEPAPAAEAKPEVKANDDLDDFLNGLDL